MQIHAVIADVLPIFISGIKRTFSQKSHINYVIAYNMQQVDSYFENSKNRCLVVTDSFLREFGEESIPAILQKHADAKIIVLTESRLPDHLRRLISIGAAGLIYKGTTGIEIEKALLHVQTKTEPYYCPVISAILISANETPVKKGKKITLSEQQLKVFLFMLQNLPNKLIADHLGLEIETVRGYRKKVLSKIKMSGYSCNIEYAVAMGYITLEQFTKKKKS